MIITGRLIAPSRSASPVPCHPWAMRYEWLFRGIQPKKLEDGKKLSIWFPRKNANGNPSTTCLPHLYLGFHSLLPVLVVVPKIQANYHKIDDHKTAGGLVSGVPGLRRRVRTRRLGKWVMRLIPQPILADFSATVVLAKARSLITKMKGKILPVNRIVNMGANVSLSQNWTIR